MADLDLDALLLPIRDDAPGGDDLEYDTDFIALEQASKPSEERVIGDSVIPAEDPEYGTVAAQATDLLTRTQDIRIASILANAQLRTRGLDGFAQALRYMAGTLETHWDHVHPQPDEEDGDLTMRVNAVLALTSREGILASLRQAALIDSSVFGPVSLRDLEIASGDTSPGSGKILDSQTLLAAFEDAGEQARQTLGAVQDALEAVAQITALFDTHVATAGPDLDPLCKMLGDIRRRLDPYTDAAPAPETPSPTEATPDAPQPKPSGSAAITTPQDVTAALDRIIEYYARFEPSSPLPILLKRAKRLVSADFVTIMKDMAPEGVSNVALIGGFEPFEGEEGTY